MKTTLIRRWWLTVALTLITGALGYWAWLGFLALQTALQHVNT